MLTAARLSPNFSLASMIRSQNAARLGLDNTPGPAEIANMTRLCVDLLEPARHELGDAPVYVSSGFRSEAVNRAAGGSGTKPGQKPSAHIEGRAADIEHESLTPQEVFDRLRVSALPYDKIILECGSWVHLQEAREGDAPRREAYTAHVDANGDWDYVPVV